MIKLRPERIYCQNEIKKMVRQMKAIGEPPEAYPGELILMVSFRPVVKTGKKGTTGLKPRKPQPAASVGVE